MTATIASLAWLVLAVPGVNEPSSSASHDDAAIESSATPQELLHHQGPAQTTASLWLEFLLSSLGLPADLPELSSAPGPDASHELGDSSMAAELARREAELTAIAKENAQRRSVVDELDAAVSETDAQLAQREAENAELEARLQALEARVQERVDSLQKDDQ